MDAIILAGGIGTRLKSVIKDIPKPMAQIKNKPFLEYLMKFLENQRINRVILSVGYKYEVIYNYFGKYYNSMEIVYSVEQKPLGTGGGIKKALSHCRDKNTFILNGDSFFNINLNSLFAHHISSKSVLTVATKKMKKTDRYGLVETDLNGRINGFKEKSISFNNNINCGVYVIENSFFHEYSITGKFSFEKEILEKYYKSHLFNSLGFDEFFIDIGVPEDYMVATKKLPNLISI